MFGGSKLLNIATRYIQFGFRFTAKSVLVNMPSQKVLIFFYLIEGKFASKIVRKCPNVTLKILSDKCIQVWP